MYLLERYYILLFSAFLLIFAQNISAQCVPAQPQNIQTSVDANGNVTVSWHVNCPSGCNNSANTSVVYYIGFYSQQSAAPNGLSGEYDFTTFVSPGCFYTELWDGFYLDPSSTADPKRSECFSILYLQRDLFLPWITRSFSVQEICNNNYGFGAGVMETTFDASYFCSGVTYDVKVWEIEIDVNPNAQLTAADIACNDLYLDESAPGVVTGAFTYPGFIGPIAAPTITISGSSVSDGTYSGQNNPVTIYCSDVVTFDYAVTPGCNFTESVAGYYQINNQFTFGAGINYPGDIGLGVEDWFIFFANNIVDGNTGQPIPYVERDSIFHGYVVSDSTEVCILAQDPCNGSSSVTCIQFAIIDPEPVLADFNYQITPINNCDSNLVEFTNLASGANAYLWDFGDGFVSTDSVPSHVFVGNGPFDVTMTAIDNTVCDDRDTVSQTISFSSVLDTVDVSVNIDTNLNQTCDSLIVDFNASGTGVGSYIWDFGNGVTSSQPNNMVVYTNPGTYQVSLVAIGQNNCTTGDTFYHTVTFNPVFVDSTLAFDYELVDSNDCDTFIVSLTSLSDGVNTLYWDFGNGTFSNDSNNIVTYSSPGSFTVMLAASFKGKCVRDDSVFQTLSFTPDSTNAVADFSATHIPVNNCDSFLVEFQSTSTDAGAYFWDFGNGMTSTQPNNTILYTDTGTYQISLIVTGQNNCAREDTTYQTVSFSPVYVDSSIAFDYELVDSNDCDTFIVSLTSIGDGVNTLYWDFGNGTFSNDSTNIITYSPPGTVTVMLAASFNGQCVNNDTVYQTLSFTPDSIHPVADFAANTVPVNSCDSFLVEFRSTSTDATSYLWDFGNGITSTQPDNTVLYADTGTYYISLIASGPNNCSTNDTYLDTLHFEPVNHIAIAAFDTDILFNNGCDSFVVEFVNHSVGGTSYLWDFGNSVTSTDSNVIVTYSDPGSYDVSLAVNDHRACSTNDTTNGSVEFVFNYQNAKASFDQNITPGCDVVELTLENEGVSGYRYIWSIDNAVVASDYTPNSPFLFYRADTLSIKLEAIDSLINSCSENDDTSKVVIIPAPFGYPEAAFGMEPVDPQPDELIRFSDSSLRAHPDFYQWDFGDGSLSTAINPTHSYAEEGEYEICLTVANEHECPDVVCKTILIEERAIVDIPTAFTPNEDNHNDILFVKGEDIEKIDLKIFNRWGELVFETQDPEEGWDGTYKGEPQEMDVYVFLLNATFKSGKEVFRKGNITLLR